MAAKLFKDEALVSQLANANTQFSLDLYKALDKAETNIFLSPISISAALAMTRLGAKGNTDSQIVEAFQWTYFSDKVHDAFEDYLQILNATQTSYNLTTANRIFIHNRVNILDEFLEKTDKYFKAKAVVADFAENPGGEEKIINAWVETQTNRRIKDIVTGCVDPLTMMVLINAIYFKGNWELQFDPAKTKKRNFKVSPGSSVQVDMMQQTNKFRFAKNAYFRCQVLEMFYVQKDLSMFFLLPYEADGLSFLEEKLNLKSLKMALSSVSPGSISIMIPKFVLESNFALHKILPILGMVDAFDGSKADFSGIAGSKDLYISQVVHKTFLEVNEEGSEAAAATAVVIKARGRSPTVESFVADHPFLFLIRDNRADIILFIGTLRKP